MSIRIIRSGLLDTVQDGGRYGYAHLGIGPGGFMDPFSARKANALLGKDLGAPLLELHFPGPVLQFTRPTVIALCGAAFTPLINDRPVPADRPLAVKAGAQLRFAHWERGARAYLATLPSLELKPWLGSAATHRSAALGGWEGRALQTGDELPFAGSNPSFSFPEPFHPLPWKSNEGLPARNEIECLIGPEWNALTPAAQEEFCQQWFQVSNEADRMGYRLAGSPLAFRQQAPMLSSAAGFGTVQLLPSGQLIVLMADHGTTGGYPRIAQVISAHLPLLSQKKPNDVLRFRLTGIREAEEKLLKQRRYLEQLREASSFRIREYGI